MATKKVARSSVTSRPSPFLDSHTEASELAERVCCIMGNIPADDLEEGYRLTPETRCDLFRAIRLLRDAYHVLRRAQEREDPIYSAYYDLRHPEEAL
ncbi:MAG: hypothetical protein WBE65_04085 [Steroidobacteraceae bacterium]